VLDTRISSPLNLIITPPPPPNTTQRNATQHTAQQELLLQDIKVGSATTSKDRRVGPALSKRIYLVFTDEDGSQKVN
jgi:hypothetical protein